MEAVSSSLLTMVLGDTTQCLASLSCSGTGALCDHLGACRCSVNGQVDRQGKRGRKGGCLGGWISRLLGKVRRPIGRDKAVGLKPPGDALCRSGMCSGCAGSRQHPSQTPSAPGLAWSHFIPPVLGWGPCCCPLWLMGTLRKGGIKQWAVGHRASSTLYTNRGERGLQGPEPSPRLLRPPHLGEWDVSTKAHQGRAVTAVCPQDRSCWTRWQRHGISSSATCCPRCRPSSTQCRCVTLQLRGPRAAVVFHSGLAPDGQPRDGNPPAPHCHLQAVCTWTLPGISQNLLLTCKMQIRTAPS